MEKFRETIKRRITLLSVYCGMVMLPGFVLNIFLDKKPFTAFIIGLTCAAGILSLIFIRYYGTALKDKALLKKIYEKENYDRKKLVRDKAASTTITLTFALAFVALMISGYFSKTVFYTLLVALLCMALSMLILKKYYDKKL